MRHARPGDGLADRHAGLHGRPGDRGHARCATSAGCSWPSAHPRVPFPPWCCARPTAWARWRWPLAVPRAAGHRRLAERRVRRDGAGGAVRPGYRGELEALPEGELREARFRELLARRVAEGARSTWRPRWRSHRDRPVRHARRGCCASSTAPSCRAKRSPADPWCTTRTTLRHEPPLSKPRARGHRVVVVRDAPLGIEVLLRRAERGDHNSGAWAFPGGLVDAADRAAQPVAAASNLAAADAMFGVAGRVLDYWVAAMRELRGGRAALRAREADGRPLRSTPNTPRLDAWRGPPASERSPAALCHEEGSTLAADGWSISATGSRRRCAQAFDTRFFVARAPQGSSRCTTTASSSSSCGSAADRGADAHRALKRWRRR